MTANDGDLNSPERKYDYSVIIRKISVEALAD